jgi:hypothetical protein
MNDGMPKLKLGPTYLRRHPVYVVLAPTSVYVGPSFSSGIMGLNVGPSFSSGIMERHKTYWGIPMRPLGCTRSLRFRSDRRQQILPLPHRTVVRKVDHSIPARKVVQKDGTRLEAPLLRQGQIR